MAVVVGWSQSCSAPSVTLLSRDVTRLHHHSKTSGWTIWVLRKYHYQLLLFAIVVINLSSCLMNPKDHDTLTISHIRFCKVSSNRTFLYVYTLRMFRVNVLFIFLLQHSVDALVRLSTKPTWLENIMLITWRWSKMSPQTWTAVGCLAASFIMSPPPWSSSCECDLTRLVKVSTLNISAVCRNLNSHIVSWRMNWIQTPWSFVAFSMTPTINSEFISVLYSLAPSVNIFSLKTLKSP